MSQRASGAFLRPRDPVAEVPLAGARRESRPATAATRLPAVIVLLAVVSPSPVTAAQPADGPVAFEKRILTDKYFCDGINHGDINRDGHVDVVAGPYWYQGPEFRTRHEFYPAVPHPPAKSPSNCMFSHVYDFNRDGWPDVLVLGRVHLHQAFWYENPQGRPGLWKKHFVFERIQGETPPFADLTGDGRPELVCHWQNRWGWVGPDWNHPTEPWSFHPITAEGEYKEFYHGTGVGDVDGDGRSDLILNDGWWKHPAPGSRQETWTAHPRRLATRGGAQIYAYDVDGDGDNDLISALDAHGWGLAWFEQVRQGGRIKFVQHTIMGDRTEQQRYGVAFSQPHAIDVADVDGDGLTDIVVGKRRWAHGPTGDVEPGAAPVIYWFQLVRKPNGQTVFRPHLIDDNSGVGVQVVAADVNGDGAADVLAASKLGSFVFLNRSKAAGPPGH